MAVIGATLGAFMAILNIQIVNASLADIQGAIGAGLDDGGWISTAYLVAEIIVIPLSGWLARVFSLRTYLLVNAVLFLVFSAACAFAENLGQMIVLRAIQGFAGGVLIPLAFTITITSLPKSKLPFGLAMFALSAMFAPAIGPTIGGYLTENFGWEYIFYINLIPGAVMVAMLWASLDRAPMQLSLLKQGDWAGIVTMAVGLGTLQTVLEEGNKDDWFGSPFILNLSIIAAVSLVLFFIIEFTTARPLINLRLVFRRNFGFGLIASSMLGFALYGSIFILPLYLGRIQGYNSEQIGIVLAWVGLPQLLIIPLVPKLTARFDPRLIVTVGFGLFAASNFLNGHLSVDYAGPQMFWPNMVRAIGQALVLGPLSGLATAGIERENASSASSLFNMMRNLGGAIGIAFLQTALTKREQYHSNMLGQSVSTFDEATRGRIDRLTNYFLSHGVSDHALATQKAIVAVGRVVQKQATVMAFSDLFTLIGIALVLAMIATALLKRPSVDRAGGESAGGGH
jgi:DHA2 family multidrug resistance protein